MKTITKNQELTVFMNKGTYNSEEIKRYPYNLRKSYVARWYGIADDENDDDGVGFYATDDDTAKWYLSENYISMPDYLVEILTDYREVSLD